MGFARAPVGLAAVVALGTSCQLVAGIGERTLDSGGDASAGLGGEAGASGTTGGGGVAGTGGITDGGGGSAGAADYVHGQLFGGEYADALHSLAVDPSDNDIVLSGHFRGQIEFGNNTAPLVADISAGDIFVARLENDFQAKWSQRIAVIAPAPDGSFVVPAALGRTLIGAALIGNITPAPSVVLPGDQSTDVFLAKYESDGSLDWAQRWGDESNQKLFDLAVDTNDQIALVGASVGTLAFGGTAAPITGAVAYLAVLDPNGVGIWSHAFAGCPGLVLGGVAWIPDGQVAGVGWFGGACDLGGGWALPTPQGNDCVAFRIEPSGVVWADVVGAEVCAAHDVAVGPQHEVVMVGGFRGFLPGGTSNGTSQTDAFAVAWNENGDVAWESAISVTGADSAWSVDVNPDGNAVIAGEFDAAYVAALLSNQDGSPLWTAYYPTASPFGAASRVAFDQSGHVIVAGTLALPFDFGKGALAPLANQDDVFLIKYQP